MKADEDAFKDSVAEEQEVERARRAADESFQAVIDHDRNQNAKRKLERMGGREWDTGKESGQWMQDQKPGGTTRPAGSAGNARQVFLSNSLVHAVQ